MTVQGDVIQLILDQTCDGEECLNRYHYEIVVQDEPLALEVWSDAFVADVLPTIALVQWDGVTYTRIRAKNLSNPIEIHEEAITGVVGGQVGSLATNQLAYAIRLNRASGLTRNGSKRLVGVTEERINGNQISSGTVTLLQDAADAMEAALVYSLGTGANDSAVPVIVGTGVDGQPNPAITNNISSAQALNRVSTQNTRKAYRA